MTFNEVMEELESLGSEQTKKALAKHGAREPFFGAKIADVKKNIVRKVKKNHELALQLYNTGNSDAMYLAGLIAKPNKMTKQQLNDWVKKAYWYMLSEYTVPWVAAESKYGWELGLQWIENKEEGICAAGWSALSSCISITPDDILDIETISNLLSRIQNDIHSSQNRVRYAMNNFVIAVGAYIPTLHDFSVDVANTIGKVNVEMGGTSCKVPYAPEYIKKIEDRGKVGVKRKTAVC